MQIDFFKRLVFHLFHLVSVASLYTFCTQNVTNADDQKRGQEKVRGYRKCNWKGTDPDKGTCRTSETRARGDDLKELVHVLRI